MKNPLVFSLMRDQSMFMTAIMSLLTFLSVLTLGIALAIGTGARRWNAQWDLFATVQIMPGNNTELVLKTINENRDKFTQVREIKQDDMEKMLRPWMSSDADALGNYLPKMYEIGFKNKSDIKLLAEQISPIARFLTHADSLKNTANAGTRMIWISMLVFILIISAIGICISYIARNTAMLHARELEILNQIGARDSFVAHQMQIIIARITAFAGVIGFAVATPLLMLIISGVRGARVGLMSLMGLSGFGWTILALVPVIIVIFSVFITKKTTYKILENN